MKVNLGCGKNKLEGWENYDSEVDLGKKLPFDDDSIEYIFAEHVVEHLSTHEAYDFFDECFRTLKPSGVVRIVVPSII